MKRLQIALKSASSYGGGVNAKGKPARRKSDSTRPSDILPKAWADMSQVAKNSVEIEYGAKMALLRRQIAELKAEHNDLYSKGFAHPLPPDKGAQRSTPF